MKFFTLIILFLCGFVNPTVAQKEDATGSFVLTDGTKGKGHIKYRLADSYSRAKLVVETDTSIEKYPIHYIQSFEINNRRYTRVNNIPRRNRAIYDSGSHNDPVFLELIESGEIEVYRYRHMYQSGSPMQSGSAIQFGSRTSYINTLVFRKRETDTYLVFIPKKSVGFYDKKASNTEAIIALFPQASEIQSLLLKDKINQEEILRYIHQYNSKN